MESMKWWLEDMQWWLGEEVPAGWKMLKCVVQEFWWCFVLAAAFWLLGGGSGGLKELVENMVYLRVLKLLVELSNFLKEVKHLLKAQLQKITFVEAYMKPLRDSMQRIESLEAAAKFASMWRVRSLEAGAERRSARRWVV